VHTYITLKKEYVPYKIIIITRVIQSCKKLIHAENLNPYTEVS